MLEVARKNRPQTAKSLEKNRPADTTPAVSAFDAVQYLEIDEALAGQRLDNFLIKILKGVPKSHIYRIVRGGEVRINKKRCAVDDRIQTGDVVRIPPIRVSQKREDEAVPAIDEKELPILFEDRDLLIVNKPAGLAAHGGSGVKFGLIERLRSARPDAKFLELAHRLDRDTSGAIIICKTRKALVRLHEMQREGEIHKHYRLLVAGDWVNDRQHVKAPLSKYVLPSGERRVKVDDVEGLKAHTIFTNLERFGDVTFLDAELKTGRTHQIRVHALSQGHPLVGDDKYGEYDFNDKVKKGCLGVKFGRMFLHAYRLDFVHPVTHDKMSIVAPMDKTLTGLIDALKARKNQ